MEKRIPAQRFYSILFAQYGPRGWWPLISRAGEEGFNEGGYHPGITYLPFLLEERFEVAVGAVLTQNTAWKNVRTCLENLLDRGPLSADAILSMEQKLLEELIRPSGYFRQKSTYLKNLAAFFAGEQLQKVPSGPHRSELLSLKGIGEETADSILLYSFGVERAVVDAYTRRILKRLQLEGFERDEDIRSYMLESRGDQAEFHALFVEHGKRYCLARNPRCRDCFLHSDCDYFHQ